jgi:hypothetical protein
VAPLFEKRDQEAGFTSGGRGFEDIRSGPCAGGEQGIEKWLRAFAAGGDAQGGHSIFRGGVGVGAGGEEEVRLAEVGKGVMERGVAAGVDGLGIGFEADEKVDHGCVGSDDGVVQGRGAVGTRGVGRAGEIRYSGRVAVANGVKQIRAGEGGEGSEYKKR